VRGRFWIMQKWFGDQKVSVKLVMCFGLIAAMIVLLAGFALRELGAANASMGSMYEDRVVCLKQIKAVGDAFAVDVVDTGHKLSSGIIGWDEAERRIRRSRTTSQSEWAAYTGTYLTPDEQRLVDDAKPLLVDADATTSALLRIVERKDRNALLEFIARDLYRGIDPLTAKLDALVSVQLVAAHELMDATQARYRQTRVLAIGAALVAVVLALVLGVGLGRTIGNAAIRVAAALGRAAERDFTARVDATSNDELGQMGRSLNTAMDRVGAALDEVGTIAESIAGAAAQLTSAAASISDGAQTQAAALEETAASLEEISAAAEQNASGATQATGAANASRDVAQTGQAVANGATEAMSAIAMVSKRIGDIVGSIDEIAFQTNILALNASIEAARAGEHGRGFGVVAQEVRALSARTADSSKQIRDLVQDTAERVRDGSARVERSSAVLGEILASVEDVTRTVSAIADASQQQSAGINQVTTAVTQLDSVTQLNAARTEELAATAASLGDNSADLRDLVARFKITRKGAPPAAPVASVLTLPNRPKTFRRSA